MCKLRTFKKATYVGVTYSIYRYPILMWTFKKIYKAWCGSKRFLSSEHARNVPLVLVCAGSFEERKEKERKDITAHLVNYPSGWECSRSQQWLVKLHLPKWVRVVLACHWHEAFRLKCSFWQWSCPCHHCSLLWVSVTAAHMVFCANDCACTCWDMCKTRYYTRKRLGPRPYLYSIVNNYLRVQNNAILFSKPDAHILEVVKSVTQSISLSQNEVL